jgi:acyl carrier protein
MIFDKIVGVICDQLAVSEAEVSLESSFKDDLGADSLDLYELAMALEEEYKVELPQDKLNDVETVEDIVKLLKELGVEE